MSGEVSVFAGWRTRSDGVADLAIIIEQIMDDPSSELAKLARAVEQSDENIRYEIHFSLEGAIALRKALDSAIDLLQKNPSATLAKGGDA